MNLPLLPLLALLSILVATPVLAAPNSTEFTHHNAVDESEAIAQAVEYLETSHSSRAGTAAPAAELDTRLVVPWAAGTRVRIAQKVEGIDVLGSELVVSLNREGEVQRSLGCDEQHSFRSRYFGPSRKKIRNFGEQKVRLSIYCPYHQAASSNERTLRCINALSLPLPRF